MERKKPRRKETGARERVASVDPYGFQRREDFDFESYEESMSEYLPILTRRAIKWSKLLKNNNSITKSAKLKRFVRKGVPQQHRSLVWMSTSGAQTRLDQNPGLYRRLLDRRHDDAKLMDSVRTDLNRTFPNNIWFQGSTSSGSGSGPGSGPGPGPGPGSGPGPSLLGSLSNVLLAYGHHNPTVGYCQGMNFLAGFLLIVTKDEEQSFWLLDVLLSHILPDYYSPSMVGLRVDQEVLGELVKLKLPSLWRNMKTAQVETALFSSRWFICLYVDVLPVETVLRVWDCLFYEGSKILFRVALTLLARNQQLLEQSAALSDVCQVFKRITEGKFVNDTHTFMESIFSDPGSFSSDSLSKLRASCRTRILAEQS